MANENGTWVMHGVSRDDPGCLHTVDEAIAYIDKIGFLPLFQNGVPGLSLEEHTVPEYWWCGDAVNDPWEWRAIIAGSRRVAYGKFFEGKAGFISLKWLPYFANYRREGYDFDALWDDEKASVRQKRVMDVFTGDRSGILSNELKTLAGFGKNGDKGFDGILTALQMQTYLSVSEFRRRENRNGEPYGWAIAAYSKPEQLWGYDAVTAAYSELPEESGRRIAERLREFCPDISPRQIKSILGRK